MTGAALPGASRMFPPEPAAVGVARDYVRGVLRSWDLPSLVPMAALLVSELATNAVLHAGTPFEVRMYRSGVDGVLVELKDESPVMPRRPATEELAMSGRGLMIVEGLAARSGTNPREPGKVVWFELHDRHEPAQAR